MAVVNVVADTAVGSSVQPVVTAAGLAQGDTTNVIQIPPTVGSVRVFVSGTTFTVAVMASPVASPATLMQIGTVTQAAPTLLIQGPVGNIIRLDVVSATGTVNIGLMGGSK